MSPRSQDLGTCHGTMLLVSLTQELMLPLFPGLSGVQGEELWGQQDA